MRRLQRYLDDARTFSGDERGNISVLATASLLVVLCVSALAIDLGALHVERRQYQGAVDLAAMAAAADLPHAEAAAAATLKANDIIIGATNTMIVETGQYVLEPAIAPQQRFRSGKTPINAVRVTMTLPGRTFFARYFTKQSLDVSVSAVAQCDNLAAFSIGSRLLNVSGGIANAVLGALLGGNVQLSAMDYDALAKFNVTLFPFLDTLASQLNVKAGTYSDVLQANAAAGDIFSALAHVADATADIKSSSALTRLNSVSTGQAKIDLSTLVGVGPLGGLSIGSQPAGIVATFNALELVGAVAEIANGRHQASLDLTAAVPGLLSVKADIAVGEPVQHAPYSAVGNEDSIVSTAQTRIRIVAQVGGTGLLAGATIRIPIYLDIADAEGRLAAITCGTNGSGSVDVAVTPGVAAAWIGDSPSDLTNFDQGLALQSAKLVDIPIAKIYGNAKVDAASERATTLTFGPSDIGNGTIKQANANGLVQGVVTSLMKNLTLNVQVAGLGIGLTSQLNALILSSLNAAAAPLDTVVDGLLNALGVHVGQADVLVDGIRCRGNGILSG